MQSENPSDPSTWKWTSADSLFLKVIEEAHKRDMKIILDGVFNHTGRHFWAFKDILEKGSRSSFASWYNIQQYDDPATAEDEMRYEGWWGIRALPSFRQTKNDIAAPVKTHIFEITKRWMDPNQDGDPSDGIDGWRLDVAEELPTGFWQDWNAWVRVINPDAYTVAESWSDKAYDFMREADFDAVMNYRFAFLANEFWVNRNGSGYQYLSQLDTLFTELGHTYLFKTQNLLGSHDTARFLSMLANEGRAYDRLGQPDEGFKTGKPDPLVYERFKLAIFSQMTLPGSPLIYNGDELGMWGADDPHNRKPMWWPEHRFQQEEHGGKVDVVEANTEMLRFYSQIIELRQSYSALKGGDFIPMAMDKASILAYERKDEKQHLLVMINTDSVAHSLPLEGNWRTAYKHGQIQISSDSLNLGATSATLLLSL
jgi:glycosidase